ncbi:MAG: hypothetical protein OXB95_12210 [Rhodobacteraceae bacterium]|nr:hypothetical protein [Paracoccaceae bacterium]
MTHDVCISRFPAMLQPTLIPELECSSIGSSRCRLFLAALERVDWESLDINRRCDTGRPPKDRVAMARAFVAKAMRNFCAAAGKKAIIAPNPRRDKAKKERMALKAKARRHACFTCPSERLFLSWDRWGQARPDFRSVAGSVVILDRIDMFRA